MNSIFVKLTQTQAGWRALFAFQVFHRPADEWLKMRWGFNAGALLDEALDRYRLFIESQAIGETDFNTNPTRKNALALRGVYSPESGLRMILLGRSYALGREQAKQSAQQYAREVFSTFPHDFVLIPAQTENTHHQLSGQHPHTNVVQIQRGILPLSKTTNLNHLTGIWNTSSRSNEQIWRALSAMPQTVLFNILIEPTILYVAEKKALLDIKSNTSRNQDETNSIYLTWVENYINRRLAPWKKFFLVQIHLMTDEKMENLVRSIGSALTRDSNELALPGYQVRYPDSTMENQSWRQSIFSLEPVENSLHLHDIADVDEVFSIFRYPYRQEAGLPGAPFAEPTKEPDSM